MERIDEDLDLHAKKKKLLRLIDAQFLAGQTPDLPKLQMQLCELKFDDIDLEIGRPRTEAQLKSILSTSSYGDGGMQGMWGSDISKR